MSAGRRAMIFIPGQGYTSGAVDVYRDGPDGEQVVVVGKADHVRQTPHGLVSVSGDVVVRFESIQAYEWARARAFERDPARYVKLIGVLGIDDDARSAPMLPSGALPVYRDDREDERRDRASHRAFDDESRALLLLPAAEGV